MKGQYRELYRRILAAGMAMGLTFTGTVPAAAANEKEETVYVFTDAEGNETKVIVSDKLKNNEGSDEIEDKSNLENIENVKGDEKYTDNGGGNITWDAQGNTIYYQGDSTQEIPIKVKVTYKLDGREIAPEDLAGKSGRVTIRYEYENTEKVTEKVGDKEEKVSVPFTVLTGLMFTNNKVSNVEVSEGKVINQGEFPKTYVNWLMRMDETNANLHSKTGMCAYEENTKCLFNGKNTTIVPIYGVGERIGTLVVAKYDEEFSDEDLLLCEYGATVVGMEMLRDHAEKIEIEARKKATVQIALNTLSFSESRAAKAILEALPDTEGLLVASKIADKVKITRSVIVNALRKFESAGVISSKSLGMKGTYIKVLNEYLLEEVQKLKI